MKKSNYILILSLICFSASAQINLDSLWGVWNDNTQADTNRLLAINEIIYEGYLNSKPDSAFYFAQIQYDFAESKGLKRHMANALSFQGSFLRNIGDYPQALDYYQRSLKMREKMGNKKGIAVSLNNIGLIYEKQGNHPKALDYYQRSLKMREEIGDKKKIAIALINIGVLYADQDNNFKALEFYQRCLKIFEDEGDKKGIAYSLNNIGLIYQIQGDYSNGLDYLQRSLDIFKETSNTRGIANALNNIGITYDKQGDSPKALDYYQRSLKMREEMGDKKGIASSFINIGSIYEKRDSPKALDYYRQSLKMREEMGDKQGIAGSLRNMGMLYQKQGDHQQAIKQCSKGLLMAQETGAIDLQREVCQCLYNAYKAIGNSYKALEYHEQMAFLKDSLKAEETSKYLEQMEFAKQVYTDSVKAAEAENVFIAQIAAQEAQLSQEKTQRFALYAGVLVLLLFGAFSFHRFKKSQAQKAVIQNQKEKVEEAHQEITDSIAYAKRIQSAILPPQNLVKEYLPDSFILYKPKDVVAGDFYWMETAKDGVFFAAADCTGHGVPGAMVSVICVNGLNRSVREFGFKEPGEILDNTRKLVIKEFEKSEEEVKDGMDIALCSLEGTTLKYAGANNPLWIVRKDEIIETKADKQPIGKYALEQPFVTHSLELRKDDSIYIFSDGYVDQFGGERGKKFKPKALRELLLSVQDKTMKEQHKLIDEAFETWRGENEQIDDVCMIGVRI